MARQLPKNRRGLRLAALALVPVYLVLWVAGTGCYGELAFYDIKLARCLFVMDLALSRGISVVELLNVRSGVSVDVPSGMASVSGSSGSTSNNEGTATIRQDRAGEILKQIDLALLFNSEGFITDDEGIEGFPIEPGDQMSLLLAFDKAIADFFGSFEVEPAATMRMPSFRFPARASRVKFSTVFDAEFGVPYDFLEGELVIDGSAAVSEGARAKVPKKVIVEVAHLNASGKVQSKHKQIIKIKNNGTFKTSRKAFKGFDVAEGERVRLRLKPKNGDLTGIDWMLQPVYNYVR